MLGRLGKGFASGAPGAPGDVAVVQRRSRHGGRARRGPDGFRAARLRTRPVVRHEPVAHNRAGSVRPRGDRAAYVLLVTDAYDSRRGGQAVDTKSQVERDSALD